MNSISDDILQVISNIEKLSVRISKETKNAKGDKLKDILDRSMIVGRFEAATTILLATNVLIKEKGL